MAVDIQNKGNGHSPGATIPETKGVGIPPEQVPEKVKAFLGIDSLKGAFTQQQISTALEKLVEVGDKPQEFIMRGRFWDRDYKNAWCTLLADAAHFQDLELIELLMNTAAGDTAIMGDRILLMVDAVIGQNRYDNRKQGFWSKLFGSGNKDNRNNND